jgi:hypothetical protein
VSEEALAGGIRSGLVRSISKRRWVQLIMEAGYDAIVWTGGLFVAAWAVGAPTDGYLTRISFWTRAGGSLPAGGRIRSRREAYRRRYLRGSREEVAPVVLACLLTPCCFAVVGLFLVTERRALLETVLGGAAVAVVAMLGARYVAFAARLRLRSAAATAMKIIVFGPKTRALS